MLWTFTGETARFALGRSHREAAGRTNDHLGTVLVGALPERFSRLQRSLSRPGHHIEILDLVGPDGPDPIPLLLDVRLFDPANEPKNDPAQQHINDGLR